MEKNENNFNFGGNGARDVKKPTKIFGLSRNVVSMGGVSFLNDLSSDMVFPFIPSFLTSLGASATFVGLVEGIADATASVVKIFSGRMADRWRSYKPFTVFGYSLSAVTKPLLAFAAAPWHVLAVRLFDRIGKGTRDAPRDALLSFSAEKRMVGRAFGFHRGADTLGATLGPLLAFFLLPLINNDLRALFLLSFIASFAAVVILKIFVRETKNHLEDGQSLKFEFRHLGRPFLIFLAAAVILSLGRASEAFLLLRAQNIGIALAVLPLVYFVYNLTFSVFSVPAGVVSDKIGHRNTYMAGMVIFSATYFLFAQTSSVFAVWLLFAVYGFFSALTEGVGRAVVADLVEERWRSTAYGIYHAFTGVALLPASVVFGFLWDKFGAETSFYYGAVMGAVALVIFAFLRGNHYLASRE